MEGGRAAGAAGAAAEGVEEGAAVQGWGGGGGRLEGDGGVGEARKGRRRDRRAACGVASDTCKLVLSSLDGGCAQRGAGPWWVLELA